MSREIWMPHAGHFICGAQCEFRLTTYVNGYIVSTVDEYVPDEGVRRIYRESRGRRLDLGGDAERNEFGFEDLGYHRKYETMVFPAKKSRLQCCPYRRKNVLELEMMGYNTPGAAYRGHLKMLTRYRRRTRGAT